MSTQTPLKINLHCPLCQRPLALRTNRQNGSEFLGCTGYPECTHTQPVPETVKMRAMGAKDMFEDMEPV